MADNENPEAAAPSEPVMNLSPIDPVADIVVRNVREITFGPANFARSVVISSVMPSAKNSCSGSREKFANGSTATDRIRAGWSSRATFRERRLNLAAYGGRRAIEVS